MRSFACLLVCVGASTVTGKPLLGSLLTPRDRSASSLLRIRGGESPLWVRGPDDGQKVQLVHSLANFCAEHLIDEDAMRAVLCGESADHEGWECGEVCVYDSPQGPRSSSESTKAAEEEVGAAEVEGVEPSMSNPSASGSAEDGGALAPSAMNKLLVGMGLQVFANQLLKRIDKESPLFLPTLQVIYCSSVLLHFLIQLLLGWRIRTSNGTSMVETVTCADVNMTASPLRLSVPTSHTLASTPTNSPTQTNHHHHLLSVYYHLVRPSVRPSVRPFVRHLGFSILHFSLKRLPHTANQSHEHALRWRQRQAPDGG